MMKFYDKLYVGFKKQDNMDNLLGFMTPYETDSSGNKRIHTVNAWRNKKIDTKIIDNLPMEGFKIIRTIGRLTTNNKLFRILDPRGFEVEISAKNMFDLIRTNTIVNGVIMNKLIWGRDTNVNVLINYDSDEMKIFQRQNVEVAPLEPGMYFRNADGEICRYEGKYYLDVFNHKYHSVYNYIKQDKRGADIIITHQKVDEPCVVFKEYFKYNKSSVICIRKSKIKNYIVLNDDEVPDWIKNDINDVKTNVVVEHKRIYSNLFLHYSSVMLSNTKKEMMDKNFTKEEILDFFKKEIDDLNIDYKVNSVRVMDVDKHNQLIKEY